MLRWQDEATALSIRLIQAFAAALDQPEDVFASIYNDLPNQRIKIIRYPGRDQAKTQGVGAHKDSGFVTILLQDTARGLQVEDAGRLDRSPAQARHLRHQYRRAAGDGLERLSQGHHAPRGQPAPGQERLSVAFFLGAKLDATVPVLELPPHLAAEARGVTQDPMNPLFKEVGRNYLKSRLRSHPDVAQRHYADVLAAQAATA